MANPQVETVSTGADKAKLAAAGVLVVGAVVAFYVLGKQDLWLRVGRAAACCWRLPSAVFFTSEPGKQLIAFGRDSVARGAARSSGRRARKRMQMTGYVFAFVVRHGAVPVADRQDARVGAVRPDSGLEALRSACK